LEHQTIPVCEPTLGALERRYVLDAVTSGWVSSSGIYLSRFEKEFPALVGARFGVAVCNGTAAIHLALKAAGVIEGDEVIVPSFTMIATANAIAYCGAHPVFVDVDPQTWTIDVEKAEKAITRKSKAILTVTIYGHPCDFGAIEQLRRRHNLLWIEDAAEGHGARYRMEPLAKFPDATAYSFYANKIITTGEGGMVCTNRPEIADRVRYYRNLAFPMTGERRYIHEDIGYNYRLTNLQAALGCAQIENFDTLVNNRRRNAEKYRQCLADFGDKFQLPAEQAWAYNCYWMFGIIPKSSSGMARKEWMDGLRSRGIETRPFFHPLHRQPVYRTKQQLPISEWLGENGFYLPSSSHLTDDQIHAVVKAIGEVLHLGG
jgi:perosamine synthetase